MEEVKKSSDIWENDIVEENNTIVNNISEKETTLQPHSVLTSADKKDQKEKKSTVLQIVNGKIVEREMTEEEKDIKYNQEIDVNSIENFDKFKKNLISDDNPHKESNQKMLDFIEKMKEKGYEMTINVIDGMIASVTIKTPDLDKFQKDFEEVTGYKFEEKEENKQEKKENSKDIETEIKEAKKELVEAENNLKDTKTKNDPEKKEAQENLNTKKKFVDMLTEQRENQKDGGYIGK